MQVKDMKDEVKLNINEVKSFTINFQHLVIASSHNNLMVLDGQQLVTVDTLIGHREEIIAFDISQVQKIVASISTKHLLIHALVDSEPGQNCLRERIQDKVTDGAKLELQDCEFLIQNKESPNTNTKLRIDAFADFACYTGALKWIMTNKVDLSPELPVRSLAMSQMGDFLVIAGFQNLAVWGQEQYLDSYMQQILYSKNEMPKQFAQIKEELDTLTGEITQVGICGSGRLIVSLEEGSSTLKIWHQESAEEKGSKVDEMKTRNQFFNALQAYELPRSTGRQSKLNAIDRFSIMHKEFNCPWIQPTVIITIRESAQEAAIWVESLTEQKMSFSCTHVVTTKSMNSLGQINLNFDALFLRTTQYHPKQQIETVEKWYSSPLLEPWRDKELYFKSIYQGKNDSFGMVPAKFKSRGQFGLNTNTTLIDFLLIIKGTAVLIYRCSGLRNFPQQATSIELETVVEVPSNLANLFKPIFIKEAFCKTFNDQMQLFCTNRQGHLVKLWCQVQDSGLKTNFKLEASNMLIGNCSRIKNVLVHPQLPVVAFVLEQPTDADHHQINVFLQSETTNPLHGKPELIYLGNFSTKKPISSAKWIPETLQLAVLLDEDKKCSLNIVSQMHMFRIGTMCSNVEQLQHELLKKATTMSAFGELHTTEPAMFEIVASVQVAKLVDIFVISHEHLKNKQCMSFAAISQSGEQQLSKLTWNIDTNPLPNLEVIEQRANFSDGYKLFQVVGSNDNHNLSSTFVLYILKKDQEQIVQSNQRRGPERKPLCKLMLIKYTTNGIKEAFVVDGTAEELLERKVQAKFGQDMVGITINQGDFRTEAKHLYLYDLIHEKYRGFFDLSAVVFGETKHATIDFCLLEENNRTGVVLFVENDVYLLFEKQAMAWTVEKKIKDLFAFEKLSIKQLDVHRVKNQFKNVLVAVTNQRNVFVMNDADLMDIDSKETPEFKIGNFRTNCLQNYFITRQRSMPLFFPSLLEQLYIKGYANLVVKLFVLMYEALKDHKEDSKLVSDYIDMDLGALLTELQTSADAYVLASGGGQIQAAGPAKGKKQNTFSAFDAFDESSQSEEENKNKGEEEAEKKDFASQFKDNVEEFVQLLQSRAVITFGMQKAEILDLISFVLRFKNIFEKDFYADPLASILLRKIFAESEKVEKNRLEQAAAEIEHLLSGDDHQAPVGAEPEEVKEVKGFSMEEFMAAKLGGATQSSGELSLCKDWTSEMVALALHSDNQDVILDMLSERFNFNDNLTWALMQRLSIPLWLKNVNKLKSLCELVVKNEYKNNTSDDVTRPKCEVTALWYILLGKMAILQKLYKVAPGQEKLAEFFGKNFDDKKTQVVAGKNAMALVPKKKYTLSMGFFLLANDLKGAIQIALDRTKDPTMAVLLCKIHDPQNETKCIDSVLQTHFIDRGNTMNDPYLINIGMWLKKDFLKAVNMLSPEKEDNCLNYIFKPSATEFNLCADLERPPEEIDISKQPRGQNFANIEAVEEVTQYPIVAQRSYIVLDLVKKLQKAPDVKRMLNKDWSLDKPKKGQKSIFDDFFEEEEQSEEEEAPKETINVDEGKILSQAVEKAMQRKQTILGLLLIEEHSMLKSKIHETQKLMLAKTLLVDFIVGYISQRSKRNQSGSLKLVLDNLSSNLGIKQETVFEFLLALCRQLGLIQLEIELLIELAVSPDQPLRDLDRIFEESQRLQGFVSSSSKFGGFLADSQDIDLVNNERMLKFVHNLQKLIDCHMLQSSKPALPQKAGQDKQKKDSIGSLEESDVFEFDVLKPNKVVNNISNKNTANQNNQIPASDSQLLQRSATQTAIQLRFSSTLLILSSMFHVCLMANKHNMAKELITQIQVLLGVSGTFGQQLSDGTITQQDMDQIQGLFKFQTIKTLLNKLELTFVHNLEWAKGAIKAVKDQASISSGMSGELARRKQSRDITQDRNPQDTAFVRLWLRSICIMQLTKTISEKRLASLDFFNYKLMRTDNLVNESQKVQKYIPYHLDFKSESVSLVKVINAVFDNERSYTHRLLTEQFEDLKSVLDMVGTHIFERQVSLKTQANLLLDIDHFARSRFTNWVGRVFLGNYFFCNDAKFRDFCSTMELPTYTATLQDHHLSLLKTHPGREIEFDQSPPNSSNLLSVTKHPNTDQHSAGLAPHSAGLMRSKTENKKLESEPQTASVGRSTKLMSAGENLVISSEQYINQKFQQGIEIFKQTTQVVSDFCFDQCSSDTLALALQARGMREIPILNTLLYRNRTANGIEFIDEELYSWSDMLHRYDQIAIVHQKLKPKSEAVRAATSGIYYKPSLFGVNRPEKRKRQFLRDEVKNPPRLFGEDQSSQYSMTYSNREVTHDDYSNAIESHPKLPLYVTGNSRGLLCLWSFGQIADKSLNQWILDPETLPQNANPKKHTIRKIAFSECGDKIAALNMDGTLFMMNFDLRDESKQQSIYDTLAMQRNKEFKISDFHFLDGDSLISCVSAKDKCVYMLDTLMPPKHSVAMQLKSGNGGNLMSVNYNKHRIYCFNQKPGSMCEYDLRMMKDSVVNAAQLSKEEITAVTCDPNTDALIVGFNDGVVKVYDEEKNVVISGLRKGETIPSEFKARETINAFTNIEGKKKPVSQIKVHPDNGSLFASTSGGVIKLLRLQA